MIPDWTKDKQDALLQFVLDHMVGQPLDVFVVGSRAGGWHRDGSDIDVAVLVEPGYPYGASRRLPSGFDGLDVSMKFYEDPDRIGDHYSPALNPGRTFQIPAYSLVTERYRQGTPEGVRAWLNTLASPPSIAPVRSSLKDATGAEKVLYRLKDKPERFPWDRTNA